MIRRLNSTGRKQIARADATVRLRSTVGNEPPIFDIDLHLDEYGFSPNARIRVEAWRSNAVQRWDYGTVGAVTPPPDHQRQMRDVPQSSQFRVMVVAGDGSGRLLGHLPSIRPVLPQKSLLPVREAGDDELGEEVWRVDFGDDDLPELLINTSVGGISQRVRSDKSFRSLVMPAVLRSILTHGLINECADPDDDESPWDGWFQLAKGLHPNVDIPQVESNDLDSDLADARHWIEAVVRAFAKDRVFAAAAYDEACRLGA